MPLPAETTEFPNTVATLAADLRALGVEAGMVLVVHSAMSKIGWINGGAAAMILALEEVLGPEGTLVMPTHSGELSDPANWHHPPVPESWWQIIRDTMPAYDKSLTGTYFMGAIPEMFRKQDGVLRSNHPDASFAAWGKHAGAITADHPLTPAFGDDSPLGRVYDLDGSILLLGVGHGNNTSLHLAEGRARIEHQMQRTGAPVMIDGARQWVVFEDIDWDEEDFEQLGADFARETGLQREGKIGKADSILVRQRALVDYGVAWLERNRGKTI